MPRQKNSVLEEDKSHAWAQGSGGARGKVTKVAGVCTVKPSDPASHDIREDAIWPQQADESEGYRR